MVSRWTFAAALVSAMGVSGVSFAQSFGVDQEKPAPAPPKPEPKAEPKPPPPKPVLVMPTAVWTPLEYPDGAEGEASVILELTLTAEGTVKDSVAVEGGEPFAGKAVETSKTWRFNPALRDGKPVASKIRFSVRFVPPRDVPVETPEEVPAEKPAAKPGEKPGKPSKPAEPLYEVTVVGERAPIRHELGRVEVQRMPGAFGDPYRAIEVLPGVVPIVSGLPYFYVRGAPPGNVGYFFDGIPVPYLYHFGAGPGVFHPAFIDRVDLYPGAYPVRYGRYAGAIVAGEMAPPGFKLRGEWNIRIIDSGAMVEAPFAGGRGTVMLGGRYSYTGLLASLIAEVASEADDVSIGYWDYQARVRYDLDSDDSVEVLGFGSSDYVSVKQKEFEFDDMGVGREVEREHTVVDVGFHRLELRWDRRLTDGNWRNSLMVGRDRTGVADGEINVFNYMVGARSELQQQLNKQMRVRTGVDLLFESLSQHVEDDGGSDVSEAPPTAGPTPGGMPPIGDPMQPGGAGQPVEMPVEPVEEQPSEEEATFGFDPKRKDFAAGIYADLVWDVAPRVQIIPALRLDLFVSGSRAALAIDPRITAEYQVAKKTKLVHGLALVHQAPSFVVPVPGLKPSLQGGLQTALQYSAGVNQDLPAGISGSLALFQSAFFDMTDPISLIQLAQTAQQNQGGGGDEFDFRTDGHAYGLEIMLRRSLARRVGGFLSYTLSHSKRFSGRLSGPATTDRTHVLNLAGSLDLGKNWRFSSRFMLYTGIPAEVAYIEAARHPPRTPAFWRVDFKIEKRWYIKAPDRWWGVNLEVLNTTLNKEQLQGECNYYSCKYEEIGPVTIPMIAFEGAL